MGFWGGTDSCLKIDNLRVRFSETGMVISIK